MSSKYRRQTRSMTKQQGQPVKTPPKVTVISKLSPEFISSGSNDQQQENDILEQ